VIATGIASGVHRVERAGTNLYVLEDADGVTIVDGGLPRMWEETGRLIRMLGYSWADVAGIVLTHGHFDHLGILARAVAEHDVPVWVHPGDARIVRHPYRYHPGRPRLAYPLLHPRSVPHLTAMVRAGALRVEGVEPTGTLVDGQVLDLPCRPVVVGTAGHTDGHVALHLPSRDVVLTGDALVTLDPYTGRTGPRIVARAGTHDAEAARASLRAIAATGARIVAPGHGEPWTRGAVEASARAQAQPVA
jgi:glyoxylase-like metal-dependent hydrolase (beta-lactamase superfamily II)